jgi:hypothetical protein
MPSLIAMLTPETARNILFLLKKPRLTKNSRETFLSSNIFSMAACCHVVYVRKQSILLWFRLQADKTAGHRRLSLLMQ